MPRSYGPDSPEPSPPRNSDMRGQVVSALAGHGVALSTTNLDHLVSVIDRTVRRQRVAMRSWAKDRLPKRDILYLIHDARDSGDMDEAFWRAFLAVHFGWNMEDRDHGAEESAGRLIFGFGENLVWTWQRVRSELTNLFKWLEEHESELKTLAYGNHRKYESKQPVHIIEVVMSFVMLAKSFGSSPVALFTVNGSEATTAEERFDVLFHRLDPLHRFGRTGRFDLLTMLGDLQLLDVRPASCYLRGSSGPLAGARKLWGDRHVDELDRLAADFSEQIGVPAQLVEDCLCNWQK